MIIYVDDRGYCLIKRPDGLYTAACHGPWTRDEAIAHWGREDYPNHERGLEFVKAIERGEEITAWPEGLHDLIVHDDACLTITALPDCLRHLYLFDGAILPESITALPESLGGLYLHRWSRLSATLPAGLRDLCLYEGATLPDGTTSLPEGLLDLSIIEGARLPESIKDLPAGLQKLYLYDDAGLPEGIRIPATCRVY